VEVAVGVVLTTVEVIPEDDSAGAEEEIPPEETADVGTDGDEAGGTAPEEAGGTSSDEAGGTAAEEAGGTAAEEAGGTTADEAGGTIAEEAGGTTADDAGGTLADEVTAADDSGGTAPEGVLETICLDEAEEATSVDVGTGKMGTTVTYERVTVAVPVEETL